MKDQHLNSSIKGAMSEAVAVVWLRKMYPWYDWILTANNSIEDKKGIDVIGTCWTGKTKHIQVKSSERDDYDYGDIPVLVIPQDEDSKPYFIGGVE